eukprot:scaffold22578_cov164-Cylindrotheca_fusiformis.AAC.5
MFLPIYFALGPAMQLLESNFPVSMSSLSPLHPFATAEKGIDGNKDGNFASKSCFHTDPSDTNPWWQVELDDSSPNGWGKPVVVKSVKIWNRTDCCTTRLDGARVELINSGGVVVASEILSVPNGDLAPKTVDFGEVNGVARIRVILDDSTVPLHFAEMEAYGAPPSLDPSNPPAKWTAILCSIYETHLNPTASPTIGYLPRARRLVQLGSFGLTK